MCDAGSDSAIITGGQTILHFRSGFEAVIDYANRENSRLYRLRKLCEGLPY
jgi:hypothetical protein